MRKWGTTMDRVMLNRDDITFLFDWGRKHKELVCMLPNPLKIVEIVFPHNGIRIKGVREEKWLTLYVYNAQLKISRVKFEISSDNLLIKRKGIINMTKESFESILACYCSLMAYMVYEKPTIIQVTEEVPQENAEQHKSVQKKGKNATYIIQHKKVSARTNSVVHHASPKGIFTVRGHLRRYKNGKVIWIKEYKKGTGDKKSKLYKLENNKV